MKNVLKSFAYIPVALFWVLNAFGGLIGGLWLIMVGDWEVVALAFIAAIVYPFVYSILSMITQFPLATLGSFLLKKGWKIVAYPTFYISILITDLIALIWIFWSYGYVLDSGDSTNIIPFLLVAYSLVVSPYTYMAKGEDPDPVGTNTALIFISISAVIYGILWVFNTPTAFMVGVILILILMLLKQIFQFYVIMVQQRAQTEIGGLEI